MTVSPMARPELAATAVANIVEENMANATRVLARSPPPSAIVIGIGIVIVVVVIVVVVVVVIIISCSLTAPPPHPTPPFDQACMPGKRSECWRPTR